MTRIRLKVTFHFDHCEIPEGTVIGLPSELAHMLVSRGVADLVEPQHAVVEPMETRARKRR
jgi:hypothetical protein